MKRFDIKDVFSWSNAEEAISYIGNTGYFAESISYLENEIEHQHTYQLVEVNINEICCFKTRNLGNYSLFLPASKVKTNEKKYRPFKSIDEFMNHLDLKCLMNNYIKVEDINTSEIYELMIVGAFVNGLVLPLYGALTMDQLFRKFKLKFNDQFLPFGVEE